MIYDFVRDFLYGGFTATELARLEDFFMYQLGQAGSFLYLDPDDNYVGPALVTTRWAAHTLYAIGASIIDAANHWQQVVAGGTSGSTIPTFNDSGSTTPGDGGVTWQDRGLFASGYPNTPMAQLPLVSDGAGNYYSPLQRTRSGLFYEDVTDLNISGTGGSALTVYANGTVTSNYTVEGPGLALPGSSYMGMYLKWNAMPAAPITAQFNFYFRVRFQSDARDMEKFSNNFWTIGGSEARSGSGMVKLQTARPVAL